MSTIEQAWNGLVVPTFGHIPGELDNVSVWTASGRDSDEAVGSEEDDDRPVIPVCVVVSREPEPEDGPVDAVAVACCELYRESRTLLLSYIVVSPEVRGGGVARHLMKMTGEHWKSVVGCFIEVNNAAADEHAVDPALRGADRDAVLQRERESRQKRHAFFAATGFKRIANFEYVQPRLVEADEEPVRCLDLGWRQEPGAPPLTPDVLLIFIRELHISCASEYTDCYDVDADPLYQEQVAAIEAVRATGLRLECFAQPLQSN